MILVEILLLLFANSTNGSGINRPQIRIRRGRKYPQLIGIKVFFLIRCAPLPLKKHGPETLANAVVNTESDVMQLM